MAVNGLLVLNKPRGIGSREVVDQIGRRLRRIPIGHTGTLDPLASGVLVLCLGQATKLVQYVQCMDKSYRTIIRLGCRSDTDDDESPRVVDVSAQPPSPAESEACL